MPGSPWDGGYWVLWGQPGCLGSWVGVPDTWVPLGWGLVGAVGPIWMPGVLGGGPGHLGPLGIGVIGCCGANLDAWGLGWGSWTPGSPWDGGYWLLWG